MSVEKKELQNTLDLMRSVPDFPKEGILFWDLMPIFSNPKAFRLLVLAMCECLPKIPDVIIGIEARGFVLASAMAFHMGTGVVLVRKAGKLPGAVKKESYALEYGESVMELQESIIPPSSKVLLVDDVIATGGTIIAANRLMKQVHAETLGVSVVLDILPLGGHGRILDEGLSIFSQRAHEN